MDSITVRRLASVRITMAAISDTQLGVMTREETAAALGVSPRTLSDKIKAGVLDLRPVIWSSYRTLFLRSDVERILSGQKRTGRRVA